MKTELQRNLLIFLQRHIKKVEDVKPEGLTTPKFNGNIVSKQSTNISKKFRHSLENGYVTDIQIIDRLCALVPITNSAKRRLSSLCDKNTEECAKKIVDIIYNKTAFHEDSCEIALTDIESNIANEKVSRFYRALNEWVQQNDEGEGEGEGENRIKAQCLIIMAFERKDKYLDLDYLNLSSLPSVITQLKKLKEISINYNHLSEFPECLYSFSTLEKIDIQDNNIKKLTTGMRMLIGKFGCDIVVEDESSERWPNIYKEYCYFHDIFMDYKSGYLKFDEEAHISVVNTDVLKPQVEEILTKSYHKIMKPKTQYELIESFDQCHFEKKRRITLKDGSVNVIGSSSSFCELENKSEYNGALAFIYQNIDTIIFLDPRHGEEEKLEFIKNCSGNDQHRFTTIKTLPVTDFSPPRLEHYEIILEQLKNNKLISKNRPKTMMISCTEGEGRTGTCLAMLKLVDEFKWLPNSAKKDINSFRRDHTITSHGGTFTQLHDDFKTTEFIANIIDNIRLVEEKCLEKAISVETPEQIATLELMHLMLIINKMQQEDPLITDNETLKLIYRKSFPKEFILSFGDSYFIKPAESVLTEADMLREAESKILRRIRNIHTLI